MRLLASGLACVRGAKSIFTGVEFVVKRSEALIVVGANGAGKSSLLRIVAGLLRPAAGHLVLEEGDSDLTIPEQAHYLGHRDPLKPSLTVAENVKFWERFLGGGHGWASDAALESVGLLPLSDIPAGYLSAGQRRRLALARLMVVRRPIWLLDEPSSTLDSAGQQGLLGLMQHHLAEGGLILAATHAPLGLHGASELRLGRESTPGEER